MNLYRHERPVTYEKFSDPFRNIVARIVVSNSSTDHELLVAFYLAHSRALAASSSRSECATGSAYEHSDPKII